MALKHGLAARPTVERIAGLVERGVLEPRFGADLREAFEFLLALRLKVALAQRRGGGGGDGRVDPAKLQRRDARLLKDALHVVIGFKDQVAHHFRLGLF
jgi:CBS domain-containing protein